MKKNLNPKKYIINVKDRPGKDKDYKIFDNDTRRNLKWNTKTSFDKGINEVSKWYEKFKKILTKRYEKIQNFNMKNNFLIKQYIADKKMKIKHNYLSEQFRNTKKILKLINNTVKFNDFTLGRYVDQFEKQFCKYQKVKYAIGRIGHRCNFFISKALDIKEGDEVITPTYSFLRYSWCDSYNRCKACFR